MSLLAFPRWFYHEFGVKSVHETGRNAYLIIAARTTRMFAFGINSVILAIFLSAINFSDFQTGLFMTFTLGGDLILGTFLTLIADRFGRRKIMLAGSVMMILSGITFAIFENFWILLLAAIVGVVSVTGGDFGPFRSIEESILAHLTNTKNRADVLAWYVTISTLGTSIGSATSGRVINSLQNGKGWSDVQAYHACFWVYTIAGIVNTLLFFCLTEECELSNTKVYTRVAQDDNEQPSSQPPATVSSGSKSGGAWTWLSANLSKISGPTRSIMYKLWFLLAVDSLADGMVPYSLTNYYLDLKFHPSKSTLGDLTSASYFLGAIGSSFAGPLARRIGLINTMVFTHIPSSLAVLLFAAPPYFWITAGLLLLRTALNPMDQAPRSAFISAVVKPDERTAVMGITAMVRTLASMLGPSATGILAAKNQFWIAFVAAGSFRLAYDLGLYAMFVNMKIDTDEEKVTRAGADQEEFELESPRFPLDSASTDISEDESLAIQHSGKTNKLTSPAGERARGRSPRRASLDR